MKRKKIAFLLNRKEQEIRTVCGHWRFKNRFREQISFDCCSFQFHRDNRKESSFVQDKSFTFFKFEWLHYKKQTLKPEKKITLKLKRRFTIQGLYNF